MIKANSFVDALRPIYDYSSMLKIAASMDERAQEIAKIVSEFWSVRSRTFCPMPLPKRAIMRCSGPVASVPCTSFSVICS